MRTMLTWCEDCGEDMSEFGGRRCKYCGDEICSLCYQDHLRYCKQDNDED